MNRNSPHTAADPKKDHREGRQTRSARRTGRYGPRHRESLKELLGMLTEKVLLDPESLEGDIHYRIGIENRNKMASPRGVEPLLPG